jgi:hypothetical protein
MRHSEFLRKQIIGIPNFANCNSNFLTFQTLEFQKNPTGTSGIESGIGILLPMETPEIETKKWNPQPRIVRTKRKNKKKVLTPLLPIKGASEFPSNLPCRNVFLSTRKCGEGSGRCGVGSMKEHSHFVGHFRKEEILTEYCRWSTLW